MSSRDNATAKASGITADVTIKPYADDPERFVVVELYIYPPALGLDSLAYQRIQKIPKEET